MQTVQQVFDRYRELHEPKAEAKTFVAYQHHLNRIQDWKHRDMASITAREVMDRHAAMSRLVSNRGTGECQANHVFRLLSSLYGFAQKYYPALEPSLRDWAKALDNPVDALTVHKQWNEIAPRSSFLELDQMRVWLKAVQKLSSTDRDFYLLCLLTGGRASEVSTLRWTDINFEDSRLTFWNTKNGTDHHIPMTRPVLNILKERAQDRHGEYVFAYPDGKFPRFREHEKLYATLGFLCRPHDLRRTCATYAHRNGVEDSIVERMLNHKLPGVTQRYIQSDAEVLRPAFDTVARVVASCYDKPRMVLLVRRDDSAA